jgi:Flp pilus assembly protein TadD
MWIPSLLKAIEGDMQAQGLKLSAEDIYSINSSSLKDAIVHFGGGCTAEIISKQGLILTNHHCGMSQIQSHSSEKNNYLTNGFWAMTKEQELKNAGLTATLIVRIEDVTQQVNKGVTASKSEGEAYKMRYENMQYLTKEAVKGTRYEAHIKPFYFGNEYYMIVTKTFKDVRLVGAPPADIGKFGGDTDNWVWPRHTGDFAVFRIYADSNNEPAEVSDKNVPYRPDQWLKVSMEGVKENDFTMVFGFPGSTTQYMTTQQVEDYINVINPTRIEMREASLSVIDVAMKSSESLYIKYASKQASISNAYKKWIGQNIGLKEKGAIDKKKSFEAEYLKRVPRDGQYKNVLMDLENLQKGFLKYDLARNMFIEMFYYGPEIIRFAYGFNDLTGDDFAAKVAKKKEGVVGYFKNYDAQVDQQIMSKLMGLYIKNLSEDLQPKELIALRKKYVNDDALAAYIYSKSAFSDINKVNKLLTLSQKSFIKALDKDPGFILAKAIMDAYKTQTEPYYYDFYLKNEALMKKYVAAQREYFTEKTFFADANSTLRLTYGKVEGTSPRDGMAYTWYTTIDGIIQKNNTGHEDFNIPTRLRELWEKKEYGPYATDGELRVCFLGSNHTTGGNSGSPALNAEGHLIGINFDRSWESTMSDVMFDPSICRNIMVDIKYVLWVIDIYGGAGHLIQEMELVDANYRKNEEESRLKTKIKHTTAQLKDTPNDPEVLMQRANAYKALHMDTEFFNDVQAVLAIQSKNTAALAARAEYYFKKDEYAMAGADVKHALSIAPSHPEALFVRALLAAKNGQYAEAVKDLTTLTNANHRHVDAHIIKGKCLLQLNRHEEAIQSFIIAEALGGNIDSHYFKP